MPESSIRISVMVKIMDGSKRYCTVLKIANRVSICILIILIDLSCTLANLNCKYLIYFLCKMYNKTFSNQKLSAPVENITFKPQGYSSYQGAAS